METIFFVVPVYKVEKYLKRCVDSILTQTYENTHIVLVDDGSPDNCPAICDEYAKNHSNIKVIHKENGGLSDARNYGINYVLQTADENDYITFVDSDDFVHRDFAMTMINLCREYNSNMAQCKYEKGSESFFAENTANNNVQCMSFEDALLGYRIKSQVCAKIFKVKVFNNILFTPGVINEDEFVTYRAVYNAQNVVFTDENLYYYFQHGSSIMADVAGKLKGNPRKYDFLKAYSERIEFFENLNLADQVLRTKEKICTDLILRYCEQMTLKKEFRDIDCVNGTYKRIYNENYKQMIKRKSMPLKRKLMHISFYIAPFLAVLASEFFKLRK